jgi:membrane protein implicated in regulation of membrane protease activity
MPIFLERFVLPILAALVTGICLLNPWKWDWQQRFSLFLGVVFLAYFFAYTSYRSKPATAQVPAPQTPAPVIVSTQKTGDATANGDNSTANTGNGNTITVNNLSHPGKKPKPAKKE